jgi:fucose 4-O-acetylase-like acetyltransferase
MPTLTIPARDRAATGGGARALAAATPADRDRYVDFLRVASIAVVVLGHWLMAAFSRDGGRLGVTNALALVHGLWLATWLLQVMPVFFFIGGFANLVAVRSVRRRGGGYAEYLSGRLVRLLRPTSVFVALWLLLPPLLDAAGVPAAVLRPAARLAAQPLWFLGVYLGVVALAPAMAALHRRHGWLVPAALAAGAAAVDLARFRLGMAGLAQLNLALVWLFAHQLGFFYADGSLAGGSWRRRAGLAAAGLAALVALTASGAYPGSMVGMPGAPVSNMNPPTVCIVALTLLQVGLVMLARERVSAWLRRPRAWTVVVAANSMVMTVYLWHVTAMMAVVGLLYGTGVPLPAPASAGWWLTRPLWLLLLGVVLLPLVLLFDRFERPAALPAPAAEATSAHGRLAAGLAASQLLIGLYGLVVSGFHPLIGSDGGMVAAVRLDPPQSLVHLAAGALLVWAARNGAAASPAPWLATAALFGLLLVPVPALGGVVPLARNLPGGVLHAATCALALAAAVTAPRGRRPRAAA